MSGFAIVSTTHSSHPAYPIKSHTLNYIYIYIFNGLLYSKHLKIITGVFFKYWDGLTSQY